MSNSIPPFIDNTSDIIRAIICFLIIIVVSLLVGLGKLDINVFLVIITGISSYYLGKSSDKGGLIK